MLEINLSASEKDLIRHWITNLRDSSGHWGGGEATFPDEAIIEHKLEGGAGLIRITRMHLEMILDWAESSHQNLAMTAPEVMLIQKLKERLAQENPEAEK